MDEDSVRSSVRKFVVRVTFSANRMAWSFIRSLLRRSGSRCKGRKAQLGRGSGGGVRHSTNCLASKTLYYLRK